MSDDFTECATCAAQPGSPSQATALLQAKETERMILAGIEEASEERDAARAESVRLQTRVDELLATCVRLTQETPFPDEFKDWQATRAAMTAEVGTLRARVAEIERDAEQHKLVMPREPFDVRCADALADEVAVLVIRKVIDSRSPAADALLDYRNPPQTLRAERLATADDLATRWCEVAVVAEIETARRIAHWIEGYEDEPIDSACAASAIIEKKWKRP